MTLDQLLESLRGKGVQWWMDSGELRVRAPKGALTEAERDLLRQYKPALAAAHARPPLVALTEAEREAIAQCLAQGWDEVEDVYPLSPLQEGILFHHLARPAGDTYLLRTVAAFDSRSLLDAFLVALQAVVDRHAALRTSIHWEGLRTPVQVVHRSARLPVTWHRPDATGETPLQQLSRLTDPARIRLELAQAPLLAAHAMPDGPGGQWLLALLEHHVIGDNYSLQIMLSEVHAVLSGRTAQLPPPVPYRDFVARILERGIDDHRQYFEQELADVDEPTAPFGRFAKPGDEEAVIDRRERLPLALARQLLAAAKTRGMPVPVLFHAAWAVVVARCSGRDDVVFGTVVSGRFAEAGAAGRALGLFINTLPLRVRLGQGRSVHEVVDAVMRGLTDGLQHEQAPLWLARQCTALPKDAPLFTSLLNFRRPLHVAVGDGPSWAGVRVVLSEERTNFPITVSVDDLGDQGFDLTAQCVAGIDGELLLRLFANALQAVAEAQQGRGDLTMDHLDILGPQERARLVHSLNPPSRPRAAGALVHSRFEAQAAQTPQRIAVRQGEQAVSYGELNARANRIAHWLLGRGAMPDARVAVHMARSVDLVAALLGVLKAGAAYVAIDHGYPAARVKAMVEDCEPLAVLTDTPRAALFAGHTVLCCEVAVEGGPATTIDPMVHGLREDHLAYVIYTSGSTGRPKGVMIEHRQTVNLLEWAQAEFPREVAQRTLAATSVGFDLAVFEIFLPLSSGASLELATGPEWLDDASLGEATLVNTVPSAAQARLLKHGLPASCRVLNLAGEPLHRTLVDRLFERTGVDVVYNLYGPSETTTYSTCATYRRDEAGPVHVGRPIDNTRLYVLDPSLRLVPFGAVGEVFIGGAGVARGYLGRPELTAQRFLDDPFVPGERIYRTGDLGRWRADGNLEYLGRTDFQVKVRGFRIELGEIEARLLETGLRSAVVVADQVGEAGARLVAYVVGEDGAAQDVTGLRRQLLQHLPDHMVPAVFIALPQLPTTPNGKIDRARLPKASLPRVGDDGAYEPPQGEIEEALAGVWADVLGVPAVGRHDNFFDLGGHSLTSLQVTVRVSQLLGVELAARQLFDTPRLADLAAAVTELCIQAYSADQVDAAVGAVNTMTEAELMNLLQEGR